MPEFSEEEQLFISYWNDILNYPTMEDLVEALSEPKSVLCAKYVVLRQRKILLLERRDRLPAPIEHDIEIPDEQWKPCIGFEGGYEVSDHGRVRSLTRCVRAGNLGGTRTIQGRVLKILVSKWGYCVVNLSRDRTCEQRMVHRLVLESFTGPHDGLVVRHLDGCAMNNKLINLRWGTQQENMNDRVGHYADTNTTILDHLDDS